MTKSQRSRRNALPATKPAPSWSAKEKYTKEMAKMLTIKQRLVEAERQFVLTCESSQPVTIEAMHVIQTTQLKGSSGVARDQNLWPEVRTNMIELNEHAAFKAPISTLVDLWVTRFGNEWVDLETVEEDEFFLIVYKRLRQMAHLEMHYLTDRARYVCRKPE